MAMTQVRAFPRDDVFVAAISLTGQDHCERHDVDGYLPKNRVANTLHNHCKEYLNERRGFETNPWWR